MSKAYPTYFDEDSGNSAKEGMDELEQYLSEEINLHKNKKTELEKKFGEIEKELKAKIDVEENKNTFLPENKNTFLPFITAYSPAFFSVFLTIFSFFIYFKLIDFNLDLILDIPNIVVPTIIINIVLFI